ncbi:DUF1484 family protein [Cupriavidus sp. UME77]|uniref:DUF1484 family protein n=1 Tax=Cupriavidus sp. UME77 TaxID=1862321 RepID=UPI0016021B5C|nr:DUF1484 family protein [Cupriavidus sp. UME77]MBB1634798.1 hypothetical protein [Cupriavidus sp. UME77]
MTARLKTLAPATDPSEFSMLAQALLPEESTSAPTDSTHETIHQSCHDLLRVSAGLESLLLLLELQADEQAANNGLHALLAPLKQQLDQAVNRVQALY